MEFLDLAIRSGVRVFDTAPAYGNSEALLGDFLQSLKADRVGLTIATKCGEHWDEENGTPFTDHSYEAMRRSIDRSLARLSRIDVLQLHKTSVEALGSAGVARALGYARSCGIRTVGASVSDIESLRLALEDPRLDMVQMPYNRISPGLEEAFQLAGRLGKPLFINRPFGMGALLYDANGHPAGQRARRDAYRFVLRHEFQGVILTGTLFAVHLKENLAAFESAVSSPGG